MDWLDLGYFHLLGVEAHRNTLKLVTAGFGHSLNRIWIDMPCRQKRREKSLPLLIILLIRSDIEQVKLAA